MTKSAAVSAAISNDWCTLSSLLQLTGWKPHTLRAELSRIGKRGGFKVIRKRDAGVTSYRIADGAA